MTFILLTASQAAQVRGASDETSMAALNPIVLTDGRYIVGAEVLADPLHQEDAVFLAGLPQCERAAIEALLPAPPRLPG